MTYEEIKQCGKLMLTAQDVSEVLECDPQNLRIAARENIELVGFNCCVIGKTMKIPRPAFIRWIEGGETK